MKLTINRITLLFGLILFADFFFFDSRSSRYYAPILFVIFTVLGILHRKSEKPYTYGRGLLIGIRILFFGIFYSLLFLLIISFVKVFEPLVSPDGRNITESVQDSLTFLFREIGYNLPSIITILIFSLIPMLIIPLFFLQKSKQTDDAIDADLMDDKK